MKKYCLLLLVVLLLPILCVAAQEPTFTEVEDNDTANQAVLLVLNADMMGSMKYEWSDEEEDWYRLYVPENGRLDIRFQHDYINDDDALYRFTVQDTKGHVARIVDIRENEDDVLLAPLFLSQGFYLFSLKPQQTMENSYVLRADFTPLTLIEEENNDDFASATPLQPGVAYQAGIGSREDVDRYLIRITQNSQVVISSERDYVDSSSTYLNVELRMGRRDEGVLTKFEMEGREAAESTWPIFLTPGDYYVTVTPGYNYYTYNYQLKADVTSVENIEAEGNGSFQYATPISVNTSYSGSLSRDGDDDFFIFTLDAPGYIDARLEHEYFDSTSTYYKLSLYDAPTNDGHLFTDNLSGRYSDYTRPRFYLDAGTYYLSLEQSNYTGRPYTLTVGYGTNPDVERGRNGTYANATAIVTNRPYLGSLLTDDDRDFYVFTLDAPSAVSVAFGFEYIEENYTYFRLALDTQANNSLRYWSRDIKGNDNSTETNTFYLDAGTYYLSVAPSSMSYKTYTLLVNAQPDPLAETEWNNEYTQADPIQPGGSVHGSLRYDGDIDRYTFTLLQAQTVRPRFSHEYYNNSDRYWVVSLDAQPNSGQRLQKIDVRGTDGDMGEAIQLAPGTYYISIEKYYFLSIPYTLHLDVVGK